MEAVDKSDGRGCIGCAVETGKVCKGCTHEDDLINKIRELNRKQVDSN